MRLAIALLAAAFVSGTAGAAHAQDSAASGWRAASLVGSTRISLDIAYLPSLAGVLPRTSMLTGSIVAAPILSPHWQVGVNPELTRFAQSGTFYQGTLAVIANYLMLDGNVSRPYVGGFVSETGTTHSRGYGAWGAQVGWLHFLSPSIALRTEARLRHYMGSANRTVEDLFLTFDPYVFARAQQPVTRLPGLGVFDATVVADLQVHPTRIGQLNGTVAPFLARWLQIGGTENFTFFFNENEGSHYLELYGRGYVPIASRVAPFADVFMAGEQSSRDTPVDHSHGERAGVRTYLAPGIAVDVAWQWRDRPADRRNPFMTFQPPEERTLTVSVTTQFRVARAR